jgi:hypothetical protein
MTTNRLLIIQTGGNTSTPWDDAISVANTELLPSLGGVNAGDCKHTVSFFQKVDTRFILSRGKDSDFILDKPYSPENTSVLKFNLSDIYSKLDEIMDSDSPKYAAGLYKSVLFGCLLEGTMSNADIVARSGFFTRQADGKIYDITNNIVFDYERTTIIPWFFCYRTDDVPLYFLVINPSSIQIVSSLDGEYNEHDDVFVLDSHLKGINSLIFNPKISRNGHLIGDQIVVSGKTLSITPFDNWFAKKYPDFFKDANIKCHSNFKFERVGNTFNFDLTGNVGYIHLRWNAGTVMNSTFFNSGSVFSSDFIVHTIKE